MVVVVGEDGMVEEIGSGGGCRGVVIVEVVVVF